MTQEGIQPDLPDAAVAREPIHFFELCARLQDPGEGANQESNGIFNNSDVRNIDDELTWWDDWVELRRTYLRAKFAYLAALQREQAMGLDGIAERLAVAPAVGDARGSLEHIEEIWRRTATLETRALLLRLDQLPDEIVIGEWYYGSAEFGDWRGAALETQQTATHQLWRDLQGDYRTLQNEGAEDGRGRRAVTPMERQQVADMLHDAASRMLDSVHGHLLGVDRLPEGVEIDVRPEGDVVLRMSAQESPASPPGTGSVTAMVATELLGAGVSDADPEQLLDRFTVAVAMAVDCALCEFLTWDGTVLRPRASSDPTADLSRLTDVPYSRAEGISGSAVLLPRDAPRRWVGTNDFANDPRGSMRHATAWEGGRGELTDYWLFPVFSGETLFGAVRVINRNRTRYTAGVPWTRAILGELHALILWFEETILPLVGDVARGRSLQPVRHRSDPAHGGAIQRLRSECQLDWIDPDFLSGLIRHMCSVAFRKVEKTSLGCCVGVFVKRDIDPMTDLLHPYKAVAQTAIGDLDAAGALYPRVSPTAGMFLFDEAGSGHGVVNLAHPDLGTGVDCAKSLTRERGQSLVMFLERGQDCVRVVTGGEVAADYYLSDATGNWTPRIYEPLIAQVTGAAPSGFDEGSVQKVFRLAVDLSYKRIGSMIILAEEMPADVHVSGGEARENLFLANLSKDVEFADLARIDGAMQINSAGAIVRCGAIVRPNLTMEERPDTLGAAGSRHRAAEDFSRIAEDKALVMVVSENRPLTVLSAGERVLDRL